MIGLGALALVTLEWLALGWLSGIRFPAPDAGAASWAVRLLVGASLVAVAELLLSLSSVGFALIPLTLLIAAALALLLRLVRTGTEDREAKQFPLTRRELVGWAVLGVVLLAAGVRSFIVPEAGWDAFSHWGLRAQAFTVAGTIVDAHSEHEYYPPLVPLLESWFYLHRGVVSIDEAKTVWAVIGSAFAICLGWHLRLALNPRWSWLSPYVAVGIVLGSTALLEGFWTGQADLPLTVFVCLATLAAWQWQRSSDRLWLVQCAIFAVAASLTKFEGLPRVAVLVLAIVIDGVLSRETGFWRAVVVLAVPAVAASIAWTAVELMRGIAPNGEHLGALQLSAIGITLYALTEVFVGLRSGGALLVSALAWLVTGRDLLRPPLRMLVLAVVCQAIATLVGFLISSTAADIEVVTSATRLFEQFIPIALFAGAIGMSRIVHL